VPHQVLVSITQDVIAVGAVLIEIERLVFKDGDEVGETLLTMDQTSPPLYYRPVGFYAVYLIFRTSFRTSL
jgi:hypothetical protein